MLEHFNKTAIWCWQGGHVPGTLRVKATHVSLARSDVYVAYDDLECQPVSSARDEM